MDDEAGIRHGLANLFQREGFTVHEAADYDSASAAAARYPWMPPSRTSGCASGKTGIDLLLELKRHEPDLVVIVITGYGSVDSAVASLKGGAADYFLKPIDNAKLLDAVRRNLQIRALAAENRFLRDELLLSCLPHQFVTRDPAVRDLLDTADRVKDAPVTVLLTGESGTGKEVLARYIHFTGSRRRAPSFPSIARRSVRACSSASCSATREGAFTGAPWSASAGSSSWPTAARCSSTRSATCPRTPRPSSCG